jgi:hypothetical protein
MRLTSDLVDILDYRLHMCLCNGWADRINYCLAITKRHEQQVALLWDSQHNAGLPEQCDGQVVKSMWSFGNANNDDRIRREISVASLCLTHSLWWTKDPSRVVATTVYEQRSCQSSRYRHGTRDMKSDRLIQLFKALWLVYVPLDFTLKIPTFCILCGSQNNSPCFPVQH